MSYNPIIFGKDELERIVSLEPGDETAEVFIEEKDGTVRSEFVNNRYWILSNKPHGTGWAKLKGNLHYSFGKQFSTRPEFLKVKGYYKHHDIYSIYDPKESLMVKDGFTYFKGMQISDVSILSFDIETTGLRHDDTSKVLIISNTFRKQGKTIRKMFCYDEYRSQAALIDAWCDWVREINPSVILGHNIFGFDFPYLDYVASQNGTSLDLGRNGSKVEFFQYESEYRVDGGRDLHYHKLRIYGREVIDSMFLAIRFDIGRKYQSYGLKAIIKDEGLEVKGRVFYDAGTIKDNYKNPTEWSKIKKYAEFDADDSLALWDLMMPQFFYTVQSIPKSFQAVMESATGSQINSIMVRSYLQNSHSLPRASDKVEFEGAISFGNAGIYNNVFKADVASLYPSIMREFKVYDKKKDPEGNFLKLVEYFTLERLKNKQLAKDTGKRYYKDLAESGKIFINSAYGFLGAPGLLFNSPENAALVTRKGREVLQTSIKWAESRNLKVTNGDTDSISFCKSDQSFISEQERLELLKELNSLYPSNIHFEDDGFYIKQLIFKAKNYAMWDGKKLKIKGASLKASSLEPALREFINRIVDTILNEKTNFTQIYNEYVREIDNIKDISRWCTRKTLTEKTYNSERSNEEKIRDAIEDTEYLEGDRIYCFYLPNEELCLKENFKGEYHKDRLLEKLFKTAGRFATILNTGFFKNYKLKRNKKELEQVLSFDYKFNEMLES